MKSLRSLFVVTAIVCSCGLLAASSASAAAGSCSVKTVKNHAAPAYGSCTSTDAGGTGTIDYFDTCKKPKGLCSEEEVEVFGAKLEAEGVKGNQQAIFLWQAQEPLTVTKKLCVTTYIEDLGPTGRVQQELIIDNNGAETSHRMIRIKAINEEPGETICARANGAKVTWRLETIATGTKGLGPALVEVHLAYITLFD